MWEGWGWEEWTLQESSTQSSVYWSWSFHPLIPLYCSVLAVAPGVVITKVNAPAAMSGAYISIFPLDVT